ncbi:MAG: hypothetical protein KKI09_00830, partial [Spirochaetes bacterium]|nr:hypothetical protein [Spirochaetota bacterium]
ALAMYPQTYMIFFMPAINFAAHMYMKLPVERLALALGLESPLLLPAGNILIGPALSLRLIFMPAAEKSAAANADGVTKP